MAQRGRGLGDLGGLLIHSVSEGTAMKSGLGTSPKSALAFGRCESLIRKLEAQGDKGAMSLGGCVSRDPELDRTKSRKNICQSVTLFLNSVGLLLPFKRWGPRLRLPRKRGQLLPYPAPLSGSGCVGRGTGRNSTGPHKSKLSAHTMCHALRMSTGGGSSYKARRRHLRTRAAVHLHRDQHRRPVMAVSKIDYPLTLGTKIACKRTYSLCQVRQVQVRDGIPAAGPWRARALAHAEAGMPIPMAGAQFPAGWAPARVATRPAARRITVLAPG